MLLKDALSLSVTKHKRACRRGLFASNDQGEWNMRLQKSICSGLALALMTTSSVSFAQTGDPSRSRRSLDAYAKAYNVSADEAEKRLTDRRKIADLQQKLTDSEANTFGGMYIEHAPNYRIVAKFTSGGAETLRRYTDIPLVVAEPATATYKQLVGAQEATYKTFKALGMESVSRIDVKKGLIEFYVDDPTRVAGLRTAGTVQIPQFIELKKALTLDAKREAKVEGGRPLSSGACTSGFTIRNTSTNVRYLTTAGHCGTPMTYSGVTLPRAGVNYAANTVYDYQWHTAPGFDPLTNVVYFGLPTLSPVTATWPYSNMLVGDWICKWGAATAYTCGEIASLNYNLLGAGGFVQVHDPAGTNLSSPGDSGAPWYEEYYQEAWGSHSDSASAVDPDDAVFMPMSRISATSHAVLTTP
jgi:hypothetical protein